MVSKDKLAQEVPHVSVMVDGSKINLFHATSAPDSVVPSQKSAADSFLSFGKSKSSDWYYAVAGDSVVLRAGKINLKSRIHSVEGFNFTRVPHLGLLLIEDGFLRKPLSGELALIERKFARRK